MSPEYVLPYVKAQKNDDRDAEAIAEAATRPTMRFVARQEPRRSSDMQIAAPRPRRGSSGSARPWSTTSAPCCSSGASSPRRGVKKLEEVRARAAQRAKPAGAEPPDPDCWSGDIRDDWNGASSIERIEALRRRVRRCMARTDEATRRLATMPGIGPINATALVGRRSATAGRLRPRARGLAAWLGLVPRQATTGGKPRLLGITQARQPLPAQEPGPRRACRTADALGRAGHPARRVAARAAGAPPQERRRRGARGQAGPDLLGRARRRARVYRSAGSMTGS